MHKNKVDIMIPALNEAQNISYVLKDFLNQKQNGFLINKILVVSDGSTDTTVQVVKSFKSKKIQILDFKDRKGKSKRINSFFKNNKSDILVVCDADIKITDKNFITKLVTPILKGYDLSSSNVGYVAPKTNIENILSVNMDLKNKVFSKYRLGNNIYTCKGVARAFSKKLSKSLIFPPVSGEDSYSYLFCIQKGFKYKYVPSAIAYIKLPSVINDHLKQSLRFINSKESMIRLFDNKDVLFGYKLPLIMFAKELVKSFIKNPVLNTLYVLLNLYSKILSYLSKSDSEKWDMVSSSKSLN